MGVLDKDKVLQLMLSFDATELRSRLKVYDEEGLILYRCIPEGISKSEFATWLANSAKQKDRHSDTFSSEIVFEYETAIQTTFAKTTQDNPNNQDSRHKKPLRLHHHARTDLKSMIETIFGLGVFSAVDRAWTNWKNEMGRVRGSTESPVVYRLMNMTAA